MENERVTATDETPQKTKNPKKVAAGKAAYAARKEKEAKMLEDLQNAKKSLRDSPKEFEEPALKLSVRETKPSMAFANANAIEYRLSKTMVWTTGLIGLGAVACYYYFQSNKISPAGKATIKESHKISPAEKSQPTRLSIGESSHAKDFTSTKSHSILKTSPQSNINDPFYMQ